MAIALLITSGTGPVEVRRFVAALASALAERLPVDSRATVGPEDAPQSVILGIESEAAAVAGLIGTHALRWRSEDRPRRARSRWYAGVRLLRPVPDAPALDPREVAFTATRASGPGGQHVNTTSSAVLARHLPSGIAVRVQSERSQHHNRRIALERLASALAAVAASDAASVARDRWRAHHELVRGEPVAVWRIGSRGELVPVEGGIA